MSEALRYEDLREIGEQYQDWITDELRKQDVGLIVLTCSSWKYQKSFGESFTGIEIKHDRKMRETGNLYFETAEKTKSSNRDYIPSGIYRPDKCWLYLIGDYEQAFLFGKQQLQWLEKSRAFREKLEIRDRENPTSRGFTVSIRKFQECGFPFILHHYKFS